jgi:hypothetical protein
VSGVHCPSPSGGLDPLSQAARAGDAAGLPAEQEAEELEGDYMWDQEYAWNQLVGGAGAAAVMP